MFANPQKCFSSSFRILCISPPPFIAQSTPMHQRERVMGKSVGALKYLGRTDGGNRFCCSFLLGNEKVSGNPWKGRKEGRERRRRLRKEEK